MTSPQSRSSQCLVRLAVAACSAAATLATVTALAASGGPAATSPMAGNGHNVTFDGRVFVTRQGGSQDGWNAFVLRPEGVRYAPGGALNLQQGAFSAPALIQPPTSGENALALCEADADHTPFACDESGAAGGPFACYDLYVFDSNAEANQYNGLRRRRVTLWVAEPNSANAHVSKWVWTEGMVPVNGGGGALRGIEPTVTRDGRLLVWQGHPANDGQIDVLMYATNATPCGTTWSAPHNLSHLVNDPAVKGVYPIADKGLRAADGTPYADGDKVRGAYPWLFPKGDALTFTAVVMPCVSTENPPGCGARRAALSVIGYPTNWTLAHIDGPLNPATDDTVRLFFSSPGPSTFPQLPLTSGVDVWPFFGSNTANQGDVVLDDGLDGQYAGVWLMNESVNKAGDLDRSKTPDTSGYFNTGTVTGATFPAKNDGLFGKALVFDGKDDWVTVPSSTSLGATNALTVSMWLKPSGPVDCDSNNNYRLLAGKGNINDGAWSLVIEEGEGFQARVRVGGAQRSVWAPAGAIPTDEWSEVGFTYEAATGAMRFYANGQLVGATDYAPGQLDATTHPLTIGGPGGARAVCPNGDGNFKGQIDEVRVSRVVRDLTVAARPGNHARFVDWTVPQVVTAGQPFQATIRYRNVGRTAWSPATMHRLGSQAPQDSGTFGTGRVELPAGRVETGQVVSIAATLTAPSQPGAYAFQWRMVHEGAEWFGETTPLGSVTVVPSCAGCNDGDDCTIDTCDPATGECTHAYNTACDPVDEPDVVQPPDVSDEPDVTQAPDVAEEPDTVAPDAGWDFDVIPVDDAGAPIGDAGVPVGDAGVPSDDTGVPSDDIGAPPVDAVTSDVSPDTTPQPADASSGAADASLPPPDTALDEGDAQTTAPDSVDRPDVVGSNDDAWGGGAADSGGSHDSGWTGVDVSAPTPQVPPIDDPGGGCSAAHVSTGAPRAALGLALGALLLLLVALRARSRS